MADPHIAQDAARLPEDIGKVMAAIRPMIAEGGAPDPAHDRSRSERVTKRAGANPDDAGDFPARRRGGNAASARQVAQTKAGPAPVAADPEIRPAIPHFIRRPGLGAAAPAPAATGADRPDPVARLAAEAAAFDAEMRAQADPSADAQDEAHDGDRPIRELLREMVQDELNGSLGERFSANLRAVIRREVAAAIDTYLDRF